MGSKSSRWGLRYSDRMTGIGQGRRLGGISGDEGSEGHVGPEGPVNTLYMASQCLLASMVFKEKLAVNIIKDFFYAIN